MKYLGYKATDKVTGFTGIITGFSAYITGCNQYLVVAKSVKNADPLSNWYDEQRLQIDMKTKPVAFDNSKTPGPDKPAPKR
jgi:hypothetical protein